MSIKHGGENNPRWTCSACTTFNDIAVPLCITCSTARVPGPHVALLAGQWTCSACTFVNASQTLRCDMCHTTQPQLPFGGTRGKATKPNLITAANVIAQRRSSSVPVKGIAGVAVQLVYSNNNLLGLITQYLVLPDLHEFRQVSRTIAKSVIAYVRGNHGMAMRLWELMATNSLQAPLITPIQQFQANVAAAGCTSYVTGSIVMSLLSGDNTWQAGDIDLLVEGNESTLASFRTLVTSLGDRVRFVKVHNSLLMEPPPTDYIKQRSSTASSITSSVKPLTASAAAISSSISEPKSKKHKSEDRALVVAARRAKQEELLQEALISSSPTSDQFNLLIGRCERELRVKCPKIPCEESGYNKHCRSMYYSLALLEHDEVKKCTCDMPERETDPDCPAAHHSIDLLFIPGADCIASGGLWGWMDRNFDVQLCVNGVNANGLRSLAPHEFLSRRVFVRTDQYCCWYVPGTKRMQRVRRVRRGQDHGRCNCRQIFPSRVAKYESRSYHVVWGSYRMYATGVADALQKKEQSSDDDDDNDNDD